MKHVVFLDHIIKMFVLGDNSISRWLCAPTRARASSLSRLHDHTQRHATVGRTLLDEWSLRRQDLYLTTHNTHNRQTSMSQAGFEPTIVQESGHWDRRLMVILPLILMCHIKTGWIPLHFSVILCTHNQNISIFLSSIFSPPSAFRIQSTANS